MLENSDQHMKRICVFLGAQNNPKYKNMATRLGFLLGTLNRTLIYGGTNAGLMGLLADTVLETGGDVVGVVSKSLLAHETPHPNLTKLIIVNSIQARKKLMMQLSDMFIILPGGLGTLEEVFEIWNAKKVLIHDKPIVLLNVNGYYDYLLSFLRHSLDEGFIQKKHMDWLHIVEHPDHIFEDFIHV